MNTKTYTAEAWATHEDAAADSRVLDLRANPLTKVEIPRPSPAELEDMSEFERARHTSKTWSMGQD